MSAHVANQTAHDPTKYNRNASFVYSDAYTSAVVQLLGAQKGERILDVGCGSGELTDRLVDLVGEEGQIWGTDSNSKMVGEGPGGY